MRELTVRKLLQAVLRVNIDQFKRILDSDQDQDTKNQASNEQNVRLVAQIISGYKARSSLVQDLDSGVERDIRQNMMGLLVAAYSRAGVQPVVARWRLSNESPLNRWDIIINEDHQEFLFNLMGCRGADLFDKIFGDKYFSQMNWLINFAICSAKPLELEQYVTKELAFLMSNSLITPALRLFDVLLRHRVSILAVDFFEDYLRTIQGEQLECVSRYANLFLSIREVKCVYFLNQLLNRGLQLDERRGAKHLITLLTAIASEDNPVVLRQIAEFVEQLNLPRDSIADSRFAAKLQFLLQCNRDFFSSDVDKRIRAERFCKLYVAIQNVNVLKSDQIRGGRVQLLNRSLTQTALDPREFGLFMENLCRETDVNRSCPFYHLEDYLELARQIMVSANLSEHEKGLRLSYLNSRVEGLLQAAQEDAVPLGSQFADEAEEASSLSGDIRGYPTLVEIETILALHAGRSARPSPYIDVGFFGVVPVDESSRPATASLPRAGVAPWR